jgi:general secretion pathway protein A
MYEAYWGLQRGVFSKQAARQSLASSPVHGEALARLDFLCESEGSFGLLLGGGGSGKSTLLAEFAERALRRGAAVASVAVGGLSEQGLIRTLAEGLQASAGDETGGFWRQIEERLEELQLESLPAVVLLDDLDRGGNEVLANVERLVALGGGLTVVATARPKTASRLGTQLLALAALRIDLEPWNEQETSEYLTASLARAGRQQPAFCPEAVRRLFELSGGAPRKVNQLAQLALLAGAGQKLVQIDEMTIDAVQEELSAAS